MGYRRDFPKIHDSVDVLRIANEMKPCEKICPQQKIIRGRENREVYERVVLLYWCVDEGFYL